MTRDYALIRLACETLIADAEREGLAIQIGGFRDRERHAGVEVPAPSGCVTIRSLPKSAVKGFVP